MRQPIVGRHGVFARQEALEHAVELVGGGPGQRRLRGGGGGPARECPDSGIELRIAPGAVIVDGSVVGCRHVDVDPDAVDIRVRVGRRSRRDRHLQGRPAGQRQKLGGCERAGCPLADQDSALRFVQGGRGDLGGGRRTAIHEHGQGQLARVFPTGRDVVRLVSALVVLIDRARCFG
jgi:hypothetical protein